ncbi:hypothetical protein MPSEU_000769100 [Mayamaea pseudoterrestris]|nr:hypothetical protein MPSEU_000769100 [Mayamaea pseudoterrestris]
MIRMAGESSPPRLNSRATGEPLQLPQLATTLTLTSPASAPTRDTVRTLAPSGTTAPTLPTVGLDAATPCTDQLNDDAPTEMSVSVSPGDQRPPLQNLLPPLPKRHSYTTIPPSSRASKTCHTKAYWPCPSSYNQYFATVIAPVWEYLPADDSLALQAANPQNNHPLYGSTSMRYLDTKIWQRRRHGWGKETNKIQTEHECPSIYHIVHILWDYLRVSLRRLVSKALLDKTHAYAKLRQRAATRPVEHLRVERHYPALDLSPICETRVLDMGAALLRCDFNYGDLVRWLGGEYTQQNQDRSLLKDVIATVRESNIPPRYPPIDFEAALQAVDEGVPGISRFRCPIRDVARREREDNRGLEHCWEEIMDKYWKEEKLSYHIMFPRFLWKYIPGLFIALISYIPPKPGRIGDEGRLINDPSTPLYPGDKGNVNGQIPKIKMSNHAQLQNPKVHYGTVIHRLVKLIYNLRLDHPTEELYMAADDISAAFRWLHYHPDIAVAFGTVLSHWLVIPVGMIFGGRFSPGWYMILGELRGHIAATLDIGNASTDLSENITLGAELDAAGKSSIVSAVQDRYNNGSRAILGQDYKFGFSSFVDDQAVVPQGRSREAIHRSVIAARVVFGTDLNIAHRVSMKGKWKTKPPVNLPWLDWDWQ